MFYFFNRTLIRFHLISVDFNMFKQAFLTSLSRVRERLGMGAGLVEADRMGGWGEEEEDEVRMGGDAEEERVGG